MSTGEPSEDPAVLLAGARTRAVVLLKHLRVQEAELEAMPPQIPAADLAAGREAMAQAAAAAGRAVAAIDSALDAALAAEAKLRDDDSDAGSR